MLTYSNQFSTNDHRNLAINKSDAQRDDTKASDPSDEHIFCKPVSITIKQRGMSLTWVVHVADTATLKRYIEVLVGIQGMNTHNKQE